MSPIFSSTADTRWTVCRTRKPRDEAAVSELPERACKDVNGRSRPSRVLGAGPWPGCGLSFPHLDTRVSAVCTQSSLWSQPN